MQLQFFLNLQLEKRAQGIEIISKVRAQAAFIRALRRLPLGSESEAEVEITDDRGRPVGVLRLVRDGQPID